MFLKLQSGVECVNVKLYSKCFSRKQ